MAILSEYRELGEIEGSISRSPNSGLTECTYGCRLNLEHCSKSQQLDTGYMCIYREVESASGLPPFVSGQTRSLQLSHNSCKLRAMDFA